jgi:putative dimethyl sulfoxide reductase chaperone
MQRASARELKDYQMAEDYTKTIEPQVLAPFARGRSSFYAFINTHFMMLPDENFVQQMRQSGWVDAFMAFATDPEVHPELHEGWTRILGFLDETKNLPAGELSRILGIDRTRLYRGVSGTFGPPPPYEGVWVNGGQETEKVLGRLMAIYREAGLALGEEFKERADYIGTEMDYLRQMTLQEAEAWESGDIRKAMETVHREKLFAESLSEWFSRFTTEAWEFAQTDLYRGHLQMVKGFLADEIERMQGLMEEIQYVPV